MDSSFLPEDDIWFLSGCHHISTGLYFQSAETLKVCRPFTLFHFAFGFVLLTTFTPHSVPSRKFATAHLVSLSSCLGYINVFTDIITLFCNSFTGFPQTYRQAPRKQDTNWIQQMNYAFLLNLALPGVFFPNLRPINLWWPANVSNWPTDTSDNNNNNNNNCSFYST